MSYTPLDRATFDDKGLPPRKRGQPGKVFIPKYNTPYSDLLNAFLLREDRTCHVKATDKYELKSMYICMRRFVRLHSLNIDLMYQEGELLLHMQKM